MQLSGNDDGSAAVEGVLGRRPIAFISHHSSQEATARHLKSVLERNGVVGWMAPDDIEPGLPFDRAIIEQVRRSDMIILLFCSQSDRSKHVKRELMLAEDHDKLIYPVRLEAIEPTGLAYWLQDYQWIDWVDRRDATIERVIQTVKRQVADAEAAAAVEAAREFVTPKRPPRGKGVAGTGAEASPEAAPAPPPAETTPTPEPVQAAATAKAEPSAPAPEANPPPPPPPPASKSPSPLPTRAPPILPTPPVVSTGSRATGPVPLVSPSATPPVPKSDAGGGGDGGDDGSAGDDSPPAWRRAYEAIGKTGVIAIVAVLGLIAVTALLFALGIFGGGAGERDRDGGDGGGSGGDEFVVEPGMWDTRTAIDEILTPMDDATRAETISSLEREGDSEACVDEELARDPDVGFFDPNGEGNCTLSDFDMADGRYSGHLACEPPSLNGGTADFDFTGEYGYDWADTEAEVTVRQASGAEIRYRATYRSSRIGECR